MLHFVRDKTANGSTSELSLVGKLGVNISLQKAAINVAMFVTSTGNFVTILINHCVYQRTGIYLTHGTLEDFLRIIKT